MCSPGLDVGAIIKATNSTPFEEGVKSVVTCENGTFYIETVAGTPRRLTIVMTHDWIRVGCHRITVKAAQKLLELHDENFKRPTSIVIQPGDL